MKNIGLILIIVGALMSVLGMIGDPLGVEFLANLCDNNGYTLGAFLLCVVGLIAHIFLNKKDVA